MRWLIFLLVVWVGCTEEEYIPDNELLFMCLEYDNDKLPSPASDYLLKVEFMEKPYDYGQAGRESYLFYDTVRTSEPLRITDNLKFGRYVIGVHKSGLSDVTELVYKGGSVQLDLILKP